MSETIGGTSTLLKKYCHC